MSKEKGDWAEDLAAEYYVREGYAIVKRNYRPSRNIEIDIVAQKDKVIAFVEVKLRNEKGEDPVLAVDDKKIRRIVKGADIYLSSLDHTFDYRFDIFAVTGDKDSYSIEFLPAAFIPPLNCL